ncbi:MAG: ClbS/DfsB family four-helix bundle protein [Bacteroidota bacterium]
MPKPKSKEELLSISQEKYKVLLELVNSYPEEDVNKEFPEGTMNRNIRDVLAHLHQWHLMMLEWYNVGMRGEKPFMPAKGYTWKTLPDLNRKIWQDYQHTDLKKVKEKLDQSYQHVQQLIAQHTNEELFEKKKYHWTGSTSLGAYLISNTSSHYHWAIKQIKKAMK